MTKDEETSWAHEQLAATERRVRTIKQLRAERWGNGTAEQQMTRLARSFPILAEAGGGVDPWDPVALMRWGLSGAMTGGSKHVVRFLLQVWNPYTDWREMAIEHELCAADAIRDPHHPLAPFNVVEAVASWDFAHTDAFRAWCEAPFHP